MTRPRRRQSAIGLAIAVTDSRGRRLTRGPAATLAAWLRRAAPARTRGAIAIAIISDDAMRRLNRTHRGKDDATDVLSFPVEPAAGALVHSPQGAARPRRRRSDAGPSAASARGAWGDIAIARGVAARQAREAGHPLRVEFRVLALHGLLHLLGYDHEVDQGEMARIEGRLRRRAGLTAGLIDRAARRPRHA